MPEEINKKRYGQAAAVLSYALLAVLVFYLMESYEHNPFAEVRTNAQLYNILLFELIAWILYAALGKMRAAARVLLALAAVFGITNHYVMKFRSTPFVPWDLFSVGTAASVAGNYDFTPDVRMTVVTLLFLLLFVLAHFLKAAPRVPWKLRLFLLAPLVLVLCLFVNTIQNESFQTSHGLYPYLFTPAYMTKVNGMALTFAMDLQYLAVEKPSGYDADEAAALLAQYETEADDDTEELPNIIVVMDEAFSDLAVLGDLWTNEDYMPFLHSLQQGADNTITGYAQVSVCGGNTANSEFEFLTGNTMAFLPGGSIPYQQYIKSTTPSLASWLAELGYATYAQHPYQASGWDRDSVYPLLGFADLDFISDYTNVTYERKYVSDASSFAHIIETYEENKETGQPAFIFNVTMQNHGGYTDTYANFTNTIVSQYDSAPLNQYLTLLSKTDAALEELVEYFSDEEEKTVIVFFGDHQPSNTVASVVENGQETDETARYLVPYLIWANYDIESASDRTTSLNYLAAQTLSAAGVPTSAYQNYLLELAEDYPVISAAGQTAADTASEEELSTYRKLQYYQLFNGK